MSILRRRGLPPSWLPGSRPRDITCQSSHTLLNDSRAPPSEPTRSHPMQSNASRREPPKRGGSRIGAVESRSQSVGNISMMRLPGGLRPLT